MQQVLKFLLIAISAFVIGYVGWTVYGEGTKTASAAMSESVNLAQAESQNLKQSMADVESVQVAARSFVLQRTEVPASASPDIEEITSLPDLLVEWRPRYEGAKLAYSRLGASIANAKSRATEYFTQQQAITQRMHDPAKRAAAQSEDDAGMVAYLQWEARADAALKSATEMIHQLDDMDLDFQKMELRADFVFDTSTFIEVPTAVTELNEQLLEFELASENIKRITGSPFEPQRP